MRKCRNWQTSKTKDLVAAMSCGFKSHLPHSIKVGIIVFTGFSVNYNDFFICWIYSSNVQDSEAFFAWSCATEVLNMSKKISMTKQQNLFISKAMDLFILPLKNTSSVRIFQNVPFSLK